MPDHCDLMQTAKDFGQGHVFTFWDQLSSAERSALLDDVAEVQFDHLGSLLQLPSKVSPDLGNRLLPPEPEICESLSILRAHNPETLDRYRRSALTAVRDGKVAVLLLAGGQGTRLGFHFPKGLYSPGLPSGRSLYQIQAEQLLRVAQLAQQEFGSKATIPWYIMTSEHTKECTVLYFKAHNYFGHDPKNVVFFEQFSLPVFSLDGKILMEKKYKLCTSPDGNGGLYQALKRRGILEDMSARGVEYVQIYGVDNILVKLPDLHFVGFCIAKSAECAAEVVEKVDADEPIGIVVRVDGRYRVVEYTELPREIASLRVDSEASPHTAPTQGTSPMVVEQARSRLVYSHGNICVHFVTREFLQRVCEPECLTSLNHHVAKKKVPHINLFTGESVVPTDPNGVKFEKFVFDVFPFAKSFAIWEVPRKERFSPLKNGPSASSDCPSTSRSDYLSFHASLALAAGAEFVNSPGNQKESPNRDHSRTVIEISPLVSYAGENLESLKGVQLQGINLLEIDKDTGQPVLIRMTNNSS